MVVTVRRKLWLPDHVIAPTLDGPFPSHKVVVFAHCELIHCYWIFSLTAHGLFQLDRPIDPSSIPASLAYSFLIPSNKNPLLSISLRIVTVSIALNFQPFPFLPTNQSHAQSPPPADLIFHTFHATVTPLTRYPGKRQDLPCWIRTLFTEARVLDSFWVAAPDISSSRRIIFETWS